MRFARVVEDESASPFEGAHKAGDRPRQSEQRECTQDGEEENGGMLALSQVLHTMGDHYTGAADDDDEMEGMVLFGDADEIRGL